jgi:hypothetical protein
MPWRGNSDSDSTDGQLNRKHRRTREGSTLTCIGVTKTGAIETGATPMPQTRIEDDRETTLTTVETAMAHIAEGATATTAVTTILRNAIRTIDPFREKDIEMTRTIITPRGISMTEIRGIQITPRIGGLAIVVRMIKWHHRGIIVAI